MLIGKNKDALDLANNSSLLPETNLARFFMIFNVFCSIIFEFSV